MNRPSPSKKLVFTQAPTIHGGWVTYVNATKLQLKMRGVYINSSIPRKTKQRELVSYNMQAIICRRFWLQKRHEAPGRNYSRHGFQLKMNQPNLCLPTLVFPRALHHPRRRMRLHIDTTFTYTTPPTLTGVGHQWTILTSRDTTFRVD